MNKRTRHFGLAALVLLLLSALISCTEGPVGIFASIAAETDINQYATKAFKGSSPAFVARLGTSYFAGIGELYTRDEGSISWSKAKTAGLPGTGPYFATSGAVVVNAIYVTFVDSATATNLGVYASADGETWSAFEPGFPVAGEKLRRVMTANDTLFAVTALETVVDGVITDTKHSLYYHNLTDFIDAGVQNAAIGLPNSVAFVTPNYWFSAGKQVLRGPVGTIASVTETDQPTTVPFGGVIAIGTQILFTGRNGIIYDRNGGTWLASSAFKNPRELTYSFGIPAFINDSVNDILLVPGENYPTADNKKPATGGYLEFNAGGFTTANANTKLTDYGLAASINNYFITLDAKSVKQIVSFTETAGKYRLFALTNGDGLWSNQFNGTSWSGWRRE